MGKESAADCAATSPAPHFVLVHGFGSGAWSWYKIRCLMENSGYRVTCLDLKGSGIDFTDPNTILDFHDYNAPLIDFLASLHHDHQVILVGHSAGGLSLSHAIRKFGKKKIKLAVFVAATMLPFGFVTDHDRKVGVPDYLDGEVEDTEFQREAGFQFCPREDVTLAGMLGRPGPIEAIRAARFEEGAEDADEVPRVFIKTAFDKVLKPDQQDAMIEKWPPSDVYVLESDHCPLFSAPFLLFGLLVKVAISDGC